MIRFLTVIIFITVVTTTALFWARSDWSKYITGLSEKVLLGASVSQGKVNLAEVEELPGPVKKYFHYVLTNGQLIIAQAVVSQYGGFRAKPEMAEWSKMNAVQYFSAVPKAFVWDARISMAPGLSITVCDSYIHGKGQMKVKLLSLIPLVDTPEDEKINSAALQRFLAESVWFPTSLLPSQGVVWEAIDNNRAKANITDAGITVSLEFEFNELGEVISIYTPERYREVNGNYELTPWKGKLSDYIEVDGYRIPSKGEVEWHLKDKTYPYWKADTVEVKYAY